MASLGPATVWRTVLPALARVVHSGQFLAFTDEE